MNTNSVFYMDSYQVGNNTGVKKSLENFSGGNNAPIRKKQDKHSYLSCIFDIIFADFGMHRKGSRNR